MEVDELYLHNPGWLPGGSGIDLALFTDDVGLWLR
jgi:hypothetical protein